jgi:hypothetical protein
MQEFLLKPDDSFNAKIYKDMTYIHAHQIPDIRLTATKTKDQIRNRQAKKKVISDYAVTYLPQAQNQPSHSH